MFTSFSTVSNFVVCPNNIRTQSVPRWVSPLVIKCRKHGTLDINDLYEPLPDCESATLTDKLEANWFAETKRNPDKPSLIRATLRTMRWRPFLIGLNLIPSVSLIF
ncbi:unnamed protein product [Rotaria sp. Silwood2]|nr:unnamed protein product [Rotaria sp. Silwood2]CAF3009541.1 unnamed protein product [Rotaria sp. Silwood2]CAF3266390.1 unnamed protein product [Rotaria sp. Silwood2]CAF3337842.1 unnamed protein product [Rotaria sp. Silwood2]CAF4135748.1 unnamed protein product [Rotaria sp. Silwood2]